jgi:hypothetical protein
VIGETVTRLRGVATDDPYSSEDTVLDWTTPAELDIPGCAVASGPTADPNIDARDMVVSDFTVYAPAGTEVWPVDRVVIRGFVCEVVGRPFDWRSPFTGREPGVVILANVVEG